MSEGVCCEKWAKCKHPFPPLTYEKLAKQLAGTHWITEKEEKSE